MVSDSLGSAGPDRPIGQARILRRGLRYRHPRTRNPRRPKGTSGRPRRCVPQPTEVRQQAVVPADDPLVPFSLQELAE